MAKNPLPGLLATHTVWVPQPDPNAPPVRMVMQRTGAGFGNVEGIPGQKLQLRAHIIPYDPKTPAQLARRALFAAAQAAWYALTPAERATWTADADAYALTGRQYFTRRYMASHAAPAVPMTIRVSWPASGPLWPLVVGAWPISARTSYQIRFI